VTRWRTLAAIAVFASSIGAAQADETPAFADWVRALYIGEVALRDSGGSLNDQEIQALFTPEIQALRARTRDRVVPASEPEGPILDILLGWGALPNRKVEVILVTADGDDGAIVTLTISENPSRLKLRGAVDPLQQTWRIDDIDYGLGGPDRTLRGRLERMTGWRPR
jgi:hypothetical protein